MSERPATLCRLALCGLTALVALPAMAIDAPEATVWLLEEHIDSMTDRLVREAVGRNEDSFYFKVYRREDGRVWGMFRLPDSTLDLLAPDPCIMYRIDDHEPHTVGSTPADVYVDEVIGKRFVAEPRWVHFLLWHGQGRSPTTGTLRNLMDGSQLVVRYYLATGGFKETRFALSDAHDVIADAIEVTVDPDPLEVRRDAAAKAALVECSEAHRRFPSASSECFSGVSTCNSEVPLEDHAAFEACVDKVLHKSRKKRKSRP